MKIKEKLSTVFNKRSGFGALIGALVGDAVGGGVASIATIFLATSPLVAGFAFAGCMAVGTAVGAAITGYKGYKRHGRSFK